MNQSDIERITRIVINPLQEIYGKYTDGMVKVLIEDLAPYSNEILNKAIRHLRRTSKFQPKIAHIIEACGEVLPPVSQGKESKDQSFICIGHSEISRPQHAKDILQSSAGQEALRLGVGRDLLCEYERTGRKIFDMDFVRKCKKGHDKAIDELRTLSREEKYTSALYDLWEEMQKREKRLYEKYALTEQAA